MNKDRSIDISKKYNYQISAFLVVAFFLCVNMRMLVDYIVGESAYSIELMGIVGYITVIPSAIILIVAKKNLKLCGVVKCYMVVMSNVISFVMISNVPDITTFTVIYLTDCLIMMYEDWRSGTANFVLNSVLIIYLFFKYRTGLFNGYKDVDLMFFIIYSFIPNIVLNLFLYFITNFKMRDIKDSFNQSLLQQEKNKKILQDVRKSNNQLIQIKTPFKVSIDTAKTISQKLYSNSETISASIEEEGASMENMNSYLDNVSSEVVVIVNDVSKMNTQFENITEKNNTNLTSMNVLSSNIHSIDNKISTIIEQNSELHDKNDELQTILQTLDELNEQIKMLSLNASIEAAKNGESGKGFSVIAKEMGGLADKSKDFTNRIKEVFQEQQMSEEQVNSSIIEEQLLINNSKESCEKAAADLLSVNDIIVNTKALSEKINSTIDSFQKIFEEIHLEIGNISKASEVNVNAVSDIVAGMNDEEKSITVLLQNYDNINDIISDLNEVLAYEKDDIRYLEREDIESDERKVSVVG